TVGASSGPTTTTPVSVMSISSSLVSPNVMGLASPPRWAIQTTPPRTTTATAMSATTVMIIPLLDLVWRTLVFLLGLAFTCTQAFLYWETVDLFRVTGTTPEGTEAAGATPRAHHRCKCTTPPVGVDRGCGPNGGA